MMLLSCGWVTAVEVLRLHREVVHSDLLVLGSFRLMRRFTVTAAAATATDEDQDNHQQDSSDECEEYDEGCNVPRRLEHLFGL